MGRVTEPINYDAVYRRHIIAHARSRADYWFSVARQTRVFDYYAKPNRSLHNAWMWAAIGEAWMRDRFHKGRT